MATPLISIIVPVYNAAEYLPMCLDSLLSQCFTDWEAICVNDGSKDDSLNILRAYAARDERIRIIDRPNGGVSSARNHGMRQAQGKYLLMVDSDDTLAPGALSVLHDAAARYPDADIVLAGILRIIPDRNKTVDRDTLRWAAEWKEGPITFLQAFFQAHRGPYARLCRTELVRSNGIEFDTALVAGEDHDFNLRCLLAAAGRIVAIRATVYNYYARPSSAVMKLEKGLFPNSIYRDTCGMYVRGKLPKTVSNRPREERAALYAYLLCHYWDMTLYTSYWLFHYPGRICRIHMPLLFGIVAVWLKADKKVLKESLQCMDARTRLRKVYREIKADLIRRFKGKFHIK